MEQGIEKGAYQNKLDTAKTMHKKGYPIEDIAELTGLSVEAIKNSIGVSND
jgi:predicted transposase/invertase (TIGR01784 family)